MLLWTPIYKHTKITAVLTYHDFYQTFFQKSQPHTQKKLLGIIRLDSDITEDEIFNSEMPTSSDLVVIV